MSESDNIKKKVKEVSPFYRNRSDELIEEHKLIYDSSSETLEPVYFFVLDKMNEFFRSDVVKLIDNFTSSPGGGHFSELMAKGTKMQEEAMKIMQTTGILIKSLINIIYDLKEFELRLSHYKAAKSSDKNQAEAGLLALKQIWMDNVDVKRGRGSLNMLAQDLSFVTIRDAFMIANSVDEVKKMDLNDRVKRILEPRIQEFVKWRELSEKELQKRYEIERTYLKSQLSSLKLYTRWAKPYLKAATQLEQKDLGKNPAIVNAFNTIVLELAIMGKSKVDVKGEAETKKRLPFDFRRLKLKRDYYSVVFVNFEFRGIPQKVGQHYVFGGLANVTFTGYALNSQELKLLTKKLEDDSMTEAMKLVEGMTDESLKELQEDIEYFLKKEDEREAEENKGNENDVNPFSALFGFGKKSEKKPDKKEEEFKEIKPDIYIEKLVRSIAEADCRDLCNKVYDLYKKAHGMGSLPGEDYFPANVDVWPAKKFFGL